VSKDGTDWQVLTNLNETIIVKSIIVATGAKWRKLGLSNEDSFIGRGVAYCPHCDGPYYKDKNVVVVGGGNSGVEAAIDLSNIANRVTLIEFADSLKADNILVDKLKQIKNVDILTSHKLAELKGDEKLTSITIENRLNGKITEMSMDGVFVQIGLSPNTDFLKDLVQRNRQGEIEIDAKGRTSIRGIYAAGDASNIPYKQIVIAIGEGAKTALSLFEDRMKL
jgi:alkyl hydroperoxide reductase subunit F